MSRGGNRLTAIAVQKAKQGKHADGHGLWLYVSDTGNKSWVFRYGRNGKQHYMGLGPIYSVSLIEARERARQARQLLLDGVDPLQQKRVARRPEGGTQMQFEDAVGRFLDVHEASWKNAKHGQQWANTLRTYAFPSLGVIPVSSISNALIAETLTPIWRTKAETARRVKQRIERVCQWVKDGMPLPTQPKSKTVKHHPALPFDQLPAFMAELRKRDSLSARALEFTILTAARTSEVTGATWDEFDLDQQIWTCPGEHTKSGKPHRVPLTERAVEILSGLDGDRPFPLSNWAMLELLKGMRPGLTTHGFRSTFSDWARDRTHYPRDVVEQALAHAIKDKTEAAYRRGDALLKRTKLMQEWVQFALTEGDAEVIPIGRKQA